MKQNCRKGAIQDIERSYDSFSSAFSQQQVLIQIQNCYFPYIGTSLDNLKPKDRLTFFILQEWQV